MQRSQESGTRIEGGVQILGFAHWSLSPSLQRGGLLVGGDAPLPPPPLDRANGANPLHH